MPAKKSRAELQEKREAARARAHEAFEQQDPRRRREAPKPEKKGINWKAVGLLLLFVLPAMVPVLGFLAELAANLGGTTLKLSTEQRLTNFYMIHNPEKVPKVKSLLRKFRGQEELLFATLEQKYGEPV